MPYRKTGYIEQILYVAKYKFESWMEWQDAKAWAKAIHPAWVEIATKCKNDEVKKHYKDMILNAYRGENDG